MLLSALPMLLPVFVAQPYCEDLFENIFRDDESSTYTGSYVVAGIVVAAVAPMVAMTVPVCAFGVLVGGAIKAIEN